MTPRCTYRVQLSSTFTFDDAAACVPYLAALGVTHLYSSPILQAGRGSTHGYDVVDPSRVSDDLGGAEGLTRLVSALQKHSMRLLLDIVPNHMATAGRRNPWWWDLLANGRSSRYAGYFDIDWQPATSSVKDKVWLGVLGDRYGRELESGALNLQRDASGVLVRYHDQVFPISAETLDGVRLDAVERDFDALDDLLQRQHYRLAFWRSAQESVNYRRFFTIDTLIGLHVEKDEVFADSHRLILDQVEAGAVSGLRVDHIDGLRDPAAYLQRLRSRAPDSYIVVEKILAPDERLPAVFPVQGTTGYDFIAAVDGLFVDPEGEAAMTALYHAFTGETQTYPEVVHASKLEIVTGELAPDVERLLGLLVEICDANRSHRDRTRSELLEALREVLVGFGVYRTYATPDGGVSEQDRAQIDAALAEAVRRAPEIDPELLAYIGELLRLQHRGELEIEFAMRLQQLTPAVMAKGVEDTAFYRFHRLISLNEVGGDPGTFGRTVARFHEWCADIASARPDTMLTLSTHDTKRSADVRARIDLLSEIPAEWEAAVRRWAEHNDRHRAQGFPDRNLEYLAYQTLVGAWPIDAARLTEFLLKAAREAKVHTSWVNPAPPYEDAIAQFASAVTADAEFTSDLESFIGRNQLVALGRTVSLAQVTLLLTCPGVPDIYQGTEVWSLALVDPDNRRPVDCARLDGLFAETHDAGLDQVVARADDGATKQWLIARLLAHRPRSAAYAPVEVTGAKALHAVAFRRDRLLVLVPRLVVKLAGDWADAELPIPSGRWTNVLTDEAYEGDRTVAVAELTSRFPIVVLEQTGA